MSSGTTQSGWIDPTSRFDPKSGFDPLTGVYRSLRPDKPLPPPNQPLSISQFCLSLFRSSATCTATAFVTDATTGLGLSFTEFFYRTNSLARFLHSHFSLSRNDVAFILAPASLHIPVLYFSLLSLGVVISPANPLASDSEVSHQLQLSKPVIAFATSQTAHKLPSLPKGIVLLDSLEFLSWLAQPGCDSGDGLSFIERVHVSQSDPAAILYSSGTTGRVKGVLLTHRNLIAVTGQVLRSEDGSEDTEESLPHPVSLFTLPLFHVFGFFLLAKAVATGETVVLMEKFDFEGMLRAVERYRIVYAPVSPPLVVAMVTSELTDKYDLSSLMALACGGAPLGKETVERFKQKFPNVEIVQGYGLTESCGAVAKTIGPDEVQRHASVGRLAENTEAKIVDTVTGKALPPGQHGELWLRGPAIMKGYVGDDKATSEALDSEGWLRTGDLCYFDSEGFLYIVDRLKELIKYKAYQVPPAELEHLLQSHPEIADVAVIPYPDEEAGQIPMAFVVRKPGSSLSELEVMDFVTKQVTPYKKIRRVAFINSIPKSPAGKILRKELIKLAVSGSMSKL
ncbi:4-coumarate--CoA ligase-like 9 [Carica papaya]|uniref:4-coumarate--CoA ligase-like 9 n=1 Tax=Carica papaya TaxID=3649 RepID=UPI000B8CCF5F|nr:4-coumarate--CoA ligase-like 9 [Carica papaya]